MIYGLSPTTAPFVVCKASDTSFFKDKDALWVKVVSNGNGARGPIGGGPGAGTSLQVSR